MHARVVTRPSVRLFVRYMLCFACAPHNNANGTPARTPHVRTFSFVKFAHRESHSFATLSTHIAYTRTHTHGTRHTATCADESLSLISIFSFVQCGGGCCCCCCCRHLLLFLLVKKLFFCSFRFDSLQFRLFGIEFGFMSGIFVVVVFLSPLAVVGSSIGRTSVCS